jgi:hypothetical protein
MGRSEKTGVAQTEAEARAEVSPAENARRMVRLERKVDRLTWLLVATLAIQFLAATNILSTLFLVVGVVLVLAVGAAIIYPQIAGQVIKHLGQRVSGMPSPSSWIGGDSEGKDRGNGRD